MGASEVPAGVVDDLEAYLSEQGSCSVQQHTGTHYTSVFQATNGTIFELHILELE